MYKYGLIFVVFFLFIQLANAQQSDFFIYTSQESYNYGDYLTFTIMVPDITEDLATLYIIDEMGKSSSPISLYIEQKNTTLTSPFPFETQIYPEGKYIIEIQYSDNKASTEFFIKNSEHIIIPIWIKDVGKLWINGTISDEIFATTIEYLINENIIIVAETPYTDEIITIPTWMKTNTKWWIQGLISDDDFAKGLEFLINIGIITI